MNKNYKTIWNSARCSLVVVNESKTSSSHSSSTSVSQVGDSNSLDTQTFKRTLLCTCIALLPLVIVSPAIASGSLVIMGEETFQEGLSFTFDNLTIERQSEQIGHLINKGEISATTTTVNAYFENEGKAKTGKFIVGQYGAAENCSDSVLKADESIIDGLFLNSGEFNIGDVGALFSESSSVENLGTIKASGQLTVKLDFINQSVAELNDLRVEGSGFVMNTQNGTLTANGPTILNATSAQDSVIANQGSLIFKDLRLNAGIVHGGTIEATKATVEKNGAIIGVVGNFDQLINHGLVELNGGSVDILVNDGEIQNNGELLLTDTVHQLDGKIINNGKLVSQSDSVVVKLNGSLMTGDASHTVFNFVRVNGEVVNSGLFEITKNANGSEYAEMFDMESEGTFINHGTFKNEAHLTQVDGTFINKGSASHYALHVLGKHENSGLESAEVFLVEKGGDSHNTGTFTSTFVTVEGQLKNDAIFTVGTADEEGTLVIDGSGAVENFGILDAMHAKTTIDSQLINGTSKKTNNRIDTKAAVAIFGDVDINAGGSIYNYGKELGQALEVAKKGKYENHGQTSWNYVTVDGDYINFGKTHVTVLTMSDNGYLFAGAGEMTLGKGHFDGGYILVGDDPKLGETNTATLFVDDAVTINSDFEVVGNGNLVFGTNKDFGLSLGLEDLSTHPSRLTVAQTVTVGEKGSLNIGTDLWEFVSTAGNLYFGETSTTVIDIGSLGDRPAFVACAKDATATVKTGAELVVGNIPKEGNYKISLEGFDLTIESGGWNNVYALDQKGSGLGWNLTYNLDENGLSFNAQLENVTSVYPNIALSRMADAYMRMVDSNLADVRFVNSVLTDEHHGIEEKTQLINTITEMGLASSSLALAINDVSIVTNSVEQRASLMNDAWTGKGNGLWADILHSQQEVDGYKASGLSVGYDASSTGFVMGYDHRLVNNTTLVGGAMSYQKGDSDSTGKVAKTNNDYSTFGVHGYVAYNPNPAFNVVGSVSYLRNAAEATTNLSFGDIKKVEADIDTDIFTVGVRAESTMKLTESVKVVPHAGIRLVHAKGSSYTTKLDGERGFKNDADAATLVQFPVGVAVRMDKTMNNGWTMRPNADVTLVAQAGDTDQSIDVTGTTGITETVDGDFTGSFNTQVSFGLEAQKDNTTVGFRYGATMGGDGKRDHQLKAEVRFAF